DRADRAEHFRAELRDLLLRSFRWRLARARAERQQAEEESVQATAEAQQAEAETLAAEQTLHAVDKRIAMLEERFSELRPRAEAFREQLRVSERALAVAHERLIVTLEQRTAAEAEQVRLQGALEHLREEETEAAQVAAQSSEAGSPDQVGRLEQLHT